MINILTEKISISFRNFKIFVVVKSLLFEFEGGGHFSASSYSPFYKGVTLLTLVEIQAHYLNKLLFLAVG